MTRTQKGSGQKKKRRKHFITLRLLRAGEEDAIGTQEGAALLQRG